MSTSYAFDCGGFECDHPEWLLDDKPTAPQPLSEVNTSEELSDYLDYLAAKAAYDKQQLREAIASGFQPENQNFTTIEQVNTYLDAWEKNQTAEREAAANASLTTFTFNNKKAE